MSVSTRSSIRVAVLVGVVAMLAAQIIFVSQHFDAYAITYRTGVDGWSRIFAYFGDIPKLFAISIVTYFLISRHRIAWTARALLPQIRFHRVIPYVAAQWLSYGIFLLLTQRIFSVSASSTPVSVSTYLAWIALAALTFFFWLLALSPLRDIVGFVWKEKWPIFSGACFGILILALSIESQSLWSSLSTVTLLISRLLLSGYAADLVTLDIQQKVLGLGNFVVEIAPVCSGYEGMGLITGLSALYLCVYRKEFKFPNALLLLPAGALIAWLLNCVRIALLVVIGYQWSPQVAIGGFHSNAGWIGFILTACLLLFIAGRYQRSTAMNNQRRSFSMTAEIALLMPFVVAMATVLVTAALSSSHFDVLYPARTVLTGLTIIGCWKYLDLNNFHFSPWPVLVGLLVALLWISMSPENAAADQEIQAGLTGVGGALWIAFRILGSVLVAPVVEEFALRGYLLATLSGSSHMTKGKIPIVPWAIAISAISFGVLHESWLAGIVAGLAYTAIRLRTAHLGHAVIAHAATNLAVFLYVLLSGNWSVL